MAHAYARPPKALSGQSYAETSSGELAIALEPGPSLPFGSSTSSSQMCSPAGMMPQTLKHAGQPSEKFATARLCPALASFHANSFVSSIVNSFESSFVPPTTSYHACVAVWIHIYIYIIYIYIYIYISEYGYVHYILRERERERARQSDSEKLRRVNVRSDSENSREGDRVTARIVSFFVCERVCARVCICEAISFPLPQ